MKFNAFGKIFSIIAMLTLVFALTFAISVTASAEEPEQNDPTVAIIITADPAEDFKTVTFSWEAVAGTRYCVYVNDVHVAVVTEPSYTLGMKVDEVVEIFIDAIDVNDVTQKTGSLEFKNHKIKVEEKTVAPTCTEDGSYTKTVTCASCKEKLEDDYVEVLTATGHDMEIGKVVDPTCSKKGYTADVCRTCGHLENKRDETNTLPHTETIIPAVEPTCTETGLTEGKKCTVCNKVTVKQQTVDYLPHTWKDATCDAPKTCTVCSETSGKAAEHKFVADPDEKAFIVKEVCESCGEVGKFLKVQIPPAYKDAVIKYGVVTLCVIVIILSIKGLMAPPTTTPWYKRRRRR